MLQNVNVGHIEEEEVHFDPLQAQAVVFPVEHLCVCVWGGGGGGDSRKPKQ